MEHIPRRAKDFALDHADGVAAGTALAVLFLIIFLLHGITLLSAVGGGVLALITFLSVRGLIPQLQREKKLSEKQLGEIYRQCKDMIEEIKYLAERVPSEKKEVRIQLSEITKRLEQILEVIRSDTNKRIAAPYFRDEWLNNILALVQNYATLSSRNLDSEQLREFETRTLPGLLETIRDRYQELHQIDLATLEVEQGIPIKYTLPSLPTELKGGLYERNGR